MHDPAPCACTGIELTAAQRAAIAARWQGCLCPGCLRALAAAEPVAGTAGRR